MDDENEVLDWEEDEEQISVPTEPIDDADGVSLGTDSGDEDENAEPPAQESSVPARVSSPSQNANSTSRHVSPVSSAPLQREDSSSSFISPKPNDSTPINSPKSQNRSQRSKSKPLSSVQMMVHGLPPKPVAAAVPFLPSSHSSLTEATAMATRETGKSKTAGGSNKSSATKPPFPDEDDGPLPPNWERRHPRSGGTQVYYYNSRTHESTWTHPSKLQSSRSQPSESAKPSKDFDDRHYRPGDSHDDDANVHERSNRYPSPELGYRRSPGRDPSPYSKQRPRSITPGRGSRDPGRRGRQPVSAKETRHANRDRDFSENGITDRHWSPPPLDPKLRNHQRQRMQDEPHGRDSYEHERSTSGNPTHDKRGARGDREQDLRDPQIHNSNHRHRSPHRERTGRRPSRFGTPPQHSAPVSDHEDWVPDEFKVEAPTRPVAQRTDINPPMQDDSAPGNALDMYDAERSSQPSDPVSENPRRKRPPLPPQSARFREARSTKASVPAPSTQEQGQLQAPKPPPPRSSAARDPPPHQQVAKFASLEIDDSAAPAHSTRRNQSPVYTDRREYENSSSTSVSADTSTGARAGSGMYADREALGVEDDTTIQLPRAPRAMGNKDDVDLGVSRAGPGRERSDRSRDFGPLHHPDRAWNEDLFIGRVPTLRGGARSSRGRPSPVAPAPNNTLSVNNRIGVDGVPNGPARPSGPKVHLSSANMVPVTNNRYANESGRANEDVSGPIRPRTNNGDSGRLGSGPTTVHPRDEPTSRRTDSGSQAPLLIRRPPSPVYRQRDPSPPPLSRESSTPPPRWQRSDRSPGRGDRGNIRGGNPVLSDTSGWVERDKHRSPSPPPPPPPALTMPSRGYGLPPKPVMPLIRSPTPDFERRTGGGGPGNNDRGRADWPRNRRSASPVDNRAQGQRQRRLSEAQFSAPERDRDRDRGRNDPPFSAAPPRRHIATEDMDIDDGPPLHRNDRNNRANEKRDGNGYDRLDHSDRPPPMRRGGSLLDRLSMGSPQNDRPPPSNNNPPPTSLRDRVQIPAKRGREDAVWEERPGQSNGFNGDVDMDDGNVGSKRRRRAQKPRRGRGGGRG